MSCPECRGHIQSIAPNWQSLKILSFINSNYNPTDLIIQPKTKIKSLKPRITFHLVYIISKLKLFLKYSFYTSLVLLAIYILSILVRNTCIIDFRIPIWLIVYSMMKHSLFKRVHKTRIKSSLFIILIILFWYLFGISWLKDILAKSDSFDEIYSNKWCMITLSIQWIFCSFWFFTTTLTIIGELILFFICISLFNGSGK